MGNVLGSKAVKDFGKCVKPQKHMPLFARLYIASINKMLNISPHVSAMSVIGAVMFNMYHIKATNNRGNNP